MTVSRSIHVAANGIILFFLWLNELPWWLSVKEHTCQCRRCRFNPWVRKIPWRRKRRKWQPTPVFLPGKFHGQKSLVGCSPRGCKESDTTEHTGMQVKPMWLITLWKLLSSWEKSMKVPLLGTDAYLRSPHMQEERHRFLLPSQKTKLRNTDERHKKIGCM